MGAQTFTTYQGGTDAGKAFGAAVSEARHEYGHGGYTGTIAEKGADGFHVLVDTPLPLAAAHVAAGRFIDAEDERVNDKWGASGAIRVAPDDAYTRKTRKLTVKTDETGYIDASALARAEVGDGIIESAKVVEDKRRAKVVVESAPRQRRYFEVVSENGRVEGTAGTRAAAKKLAREYAQRDLDGQVTASGLVFRPPHLSTYAVRGVTGAADGGPLDKARTVQTGRTVKIEVVVATPKSGRPGTAGWLFFGWASS